MGILPPAGVERVLTVVKKMAMPKHRLSCRVSTEDCDFKLRTRLEPSARGHYQMSRGPMSLADTFSKRSCK